MKDILKDMEAQIVSKHNTLRLQLGSMIDAALKSTDRNLDKIKFIKSIFGYNLVTVNAILKGIDEGKSFVDVTNELNAKGLLN